MSTAIALANRHRNAFCVIWPLAILLAIVSIADVRAGSDPSIAYRPFAAGRQRSNWDNRFGNAAAPVVPHSAVARIIVPEGGATSFGSGTLIDVRDQYGLVVTNWHVVRDAKGVVEVVFPGGFRSQARPLKVDKDWDLAALVIWRPPVEPVQMADRAPQKGDQLTIHGYGQGQYRVATGHCTSYYAPRVDYPHEMVELDVEARQGDSGGPIFNGQGELAGVLFGAGQGTTIGSFGGRVETFLASLAPDIGRAEAQLADARDRITPAINAPSDFSAVAESIGKAKPLAHSGSRQPNRTAAAWPSSQWSVADTRPANPAATEANAAPAASQTLNVTDNHFSHWFELMRNVLAAIGIVSIALFLVRLVK